jgi:hypothetical protein
MLTPRRHWPIVLGIAGLLPVASVPLYELWAAKATERAYARIAVGMPQGDLYSALGGPPDVSEIRMGYVVGPEEQHFEVPSEYAFKLPEVYAIRFEKWQLPCADISVVSEPNGGVLCRYKAETPRWWQRWATALGF